MELEFDNEIDALLRKEARGRTITIGEFAGVHLDADEIAAFVENAVPDRTRGSFIEHFASCDPCRRTLSKAGVLHSPEELEQGESIAAPVIEAAVPWYRRLFLFPNLAYVMGGFVLLFAGFIGLSVVYRTSQTGQFEMSKAVSNEAPSAPESIAATNSNAAASASNASANTMANADDIVEPTIPNDGLATPLDEVASNRTVAKGPSFADTDYESRNLRPTASRPSPPAKDSPVILDGVQGRRSQDLKMSPAPAAPAKERKSEDQKSMSELPAATRNAPKNKVPDRTDRQSADRETRGRTENDAALKKSDKAAAGSAITSDTKQVSGKTFQLRQGAWYDTTYRGQGTVNIRRKSDNYKKLDRGLRGIAESFIGTVVTVWNGTAYRID